MAAIDIKLINLVKKLYYKEYCSMKEIGEKFGVSWGAVYYFMKRHNLKRRTFSEENRIRFSKKPLSFCLKSNLSKSEYRLKIMGIMIYWAEGSRVGVKSEIVDFANSDPEMIKIFISFLRKICGIDESKLRVLLYCYSNQNVNNLINFWSTLTKISKIQFTKPYVRDDFKKNKVNKMFYGLVHIRYCDKKLLLTISRWKDNLIKEFN